MAEKPARTIWTDVSTVFVTGFDTHFLHLGRRFENSGHATSWLWKKVNSCFTLGLALLSCLSKNTSKWRFRLVSPKTRSVFVFSEVGKIWKFSIKIGEIFDPRDFLTKIGTNRKDSVKLQYHFANLNLIALQIRKCFVIIEMQPVCILRRLHTRWLVPGGTAPPGACTCFSPAVIAAAAPAIISKRWCYRSRQEHQALNQDWHQFTCISCITCERNAIIS